MDNIKGTIIDEAHRIGIDVIGFAPCSVLNNAREILKDRENKGYLSGFEEKDIEKRIDPSLQLEGCKTIISAGISYRTDEKNIKLKSSYICKCIVSKSSWGIDYHNVLRHKLKELSQFIECRYGARTKLFVDTGPLLEREIARMAGVGFVGKNGFIINDEFGSFIFLGEILLDICIEPDEPAEGGCKDCDICIRACHTRALFSPYTLNAKRCISYMTQSKTISPKDYDALGCNIYGCDICQDVCPKNKSIRFKNHTEFIPECWNSFPDAADILNMDNKTYNKTFKNTASGWRGKRILQRNAVISLGNSHDREAARYIINMLSDGRKEIRETSIYALYKLLGKESFPVLKRCRDIESDDDLKRIINCLIDNA